MRKVKSNIGWLITKAGYNRDFLRKRYNKSANTISNWCTGKSHPSVAEMFDLALLLDCKVDELYERLDEDESTNSKT